MERHEGGKEGRLRHVEKAICGGGGQAAPRREGHVLLNEDLHQVDVAAGGCSVQGSPQLVVLGVHVCTMGKQQLDDFFKVVNAALGGGGTRRRQSEARRGPGPWWGHTTLPTTDHEKDSGDRQPEFESSFVPLGKALCLLESASLLSRREADNVQDKTTSANSPSRLSRVFMSVSGAAFNLNELLRSQTAFSRQHPKGNS